MTQSHQQELEANYVMSTYARKPVELVSGEGMRVVDVDGKKYLDFVAGSGASNLGHSHPHVARALADQASKLIHVGNYYYIEGRGETARKISDLLSETQADNEFWKSFFANSGAEANECAIKLARLWGKKNKQGHIVVTLKKSFHGRTLATLSATAQPSKQEVFQPLPEGFMHVPINDLQALADVFEQQGDAICAVMLEPIQGESGVYPCSTEYLQAVADLVHDNNSLLICDEIQCGMYRSGTYPFCFQHHGITPDIVTIAKGIGGGFPTGVCAARESIADTFEPGDHGSTFGGSSLAIAAINAAIDTYHSESLGDNAESVGAYLREQLATLPEVKEIRGKGLMVACEFNDSVDAFAVVNDGLSEGLLLNSTGPHTLRFIPPLVCSKSDVDLLISKLLKLLNSQQQGV